MIAGFEFVASYAAAGAGVVALLAAIPVIGLSVGLGISLVRGFLR